MSTIKPKQFQVHRAFLKECLLREESEYETRLRSADYDVDNRFKDIGSANKDVQAELKSTEWRNQFAANLTDYPSEPPTTVKGTFVRLFRRDSPHCAGLLSDCGQWKLVLRHSPVPSIECETISYAWGSPEHAIAAEWSTIGVKIKLGGEWDHAAFLEEIATISQRAWCWLDQLCLKQDKLESVDVMTNIPMIYTRCTVNVLIATTNCERFAWLFGLIKACWRECPYTAHTFFFLHFAYCSCLTGLGNGWTSRAWPWQELMYARKMRMALVGGLPKKIYISSYAVLSVREQFRVRIGQSKLSEQAQLVHATLCACPTLHMQRLVWNQVLRDVPREIDAEGITIVLALLCKEVVTLPKVYQIPVADLPNFVRFYAVHHRVCSEPRDYILSIVPLISGYTLPSKFKTMTAVQLLNDLETQFCAKSNFEYVGGLLPGMLTGGDAIYWHKGVTRLLEEDHGKVADTFALFKRFWFSNYIPKEMGDYVKGTRVLTRSITRLVLDPVKEGFIETMEKIIDCTHPDQSEFVTHMNLDSEDSDVSGLTKLLYMRYEFFHGHGRFNLDYLPSNVWPCSANMFSDEQAWIRACLAVLGATIDTQYHEVPVMLPSLQLLKIVFDDESSALGYARKNCKKPIVFQVGPALFIGEETDGVVCAVGRIPVVVQILIDPKGDVWVQRNTLVPVPSFMPESAKADYRLGLKELEAKLAAMSPTNIKKQVKLDNFELVLRGKLLR